MRLLISLADFLLALSILFCHYIFDSYVTCLTLSPNTIFVFNGLVAKELDSNPGVLCSKPLGGSKVDSVFHPSEVDKMRSIKFISKLKY